MKLLFSTLSILFSLILLQGCTKNLIDTTNTVVKAATPVNIGTYKRTPNDNDLSMAAIDNIVSSDIYKKDMRINIVTNNGHVLLIGQIDTEINKAKIEKSVFSLKGVKEVYNQLRVSKPISLLQQIEDSLTTIKVKTQLVRHDKVKALKIKVVTEDAEVFLIGNVSKEVAYYATFVTRQVTGVEKVVKVFEILPE
jgi:osmotically-inducible protein OsmY